MSCPGEYDANDMVFCGCISVVISAFLSIFFTWMLTYNTMNASWQKESISRGYATYQRNNCNVYTFVWKDDKMNNNTIQEGINQ